jgi:FkbM family methyltransferase
MKHLVPGAKACAFLLNALLHKSLARDRENIALCILNALYSLEGNNVTIARSRAFKSIYTVTERATAEARTVSSLTRARWLYKSGFKARAIQIAKSYLIDDLCINKGDTVIDCGANYGDLKMYLDTLGCDAHYLAFEPSNLDYHCLMQNHGASDKRDGSSNLYLQAALGAENGKLQLFEDSRSASSSLLPTPKADSSYEVSVSKLDSVMQRYNLQGTPIKLLKLEAEGLEPEVCQGMTSTLQCIEYIAADVGYERGMTQETTAPATINCLLSHGFEIARADLLQGKFLFARKRGM